MAQRKTASFAEEEGSECPDDALAASALQLGAASAPPPHHPSPEERLRGALTLGIAHLEERLSRRPERNILTQDFKTEESVFFPAEGGGASGSTPAHGLGDFTFRAFAPVAFRYFRGALGVRPDEYHAVLGDLSLTEQQRPPGGGSQGGDVVNDGGDSSEARPLYVSSDDRFALRRLRSRQVGVLRGLLHGYYLNLKQNERRTRLPTLMPHLYGLYAVTLSQGGGLHHVLATNVLVPRGVPLHRRYHLKGSTYRRRAVVEEGGEGEEGEEVPTYKDLDFLGEPNLQLEAEHYEAVSSTIRKDCLVLQSEGIMNYRLVVAVHYLDRALPGPEAAAVVPGASQEEEELRRVGGGHHHHHHHHHHHNKSECVTANATPSPPSLTMSSSYAAAAAAAMGGGIPARDAQGERVLLFVGMEGVLQRYTLARRAERAWKALRTGDGDAVSATRPAFYAHRFTRFMCNTVFTKRVTMGPPPRAVAPLPPPPTPPPPPPPPTSSTPSSSSSSSSNNRRVSKKARGGGGGDNNNTPSPSAPPPSPPYPPPAPPSCCRTIKDVQLHLHHLQLHLHHLGGGEEGGEVSPDPCPICTS